MPAKDGADVAVLRFAVSSDRNRDPSPGQRQRELRLRGWSASIAQRADALLRGFFIPHAEHFYDMLCGGGAARRIRSLAVAILRCEKDDIVLRDVGRLCRAIRNEKRDVQIGMMQQFEHFAWLTRLDHTGNAFPRWQRMAGLKTRFEEDLKRETAARKAMSEAIKADATARKAAKEE